MVRRLHDKFMFNVLAFNQQNTADIMEAGKGYMIPGVTSEQFKSVAEAIERVEQLKTITDEVAVGLGGGGKYANWKKALDISVATQPKHLNQPFEKAAFAKGFLEAHDMTKPIVNALVWTTGQVGKIRLTSGLILSVDVFLDMSMGLGIESIKLMPVHNGNLNELFDLTEKAARRGIRGVEIAGDIDKHNINPIIKGVKSIDIEFFMPHIFEPLLDRKTGETSPVKIQELITAAET